MTSPCFIFSGDKESVTNVNIDALYDKQHQRNLKQIAMYNKILNRIHLRINTVGKSRTNNKIIHYAVPLLIFGEALYNINDCIAYIIINLEENGFEVTHTLPNWLSVSWNKWVPTYVRNEYRKNTGQKIDSFGNIIVEPVEQTNIPTTNNKPKQNYVSTETYKPNGNFVYNPDILEKIERKVSFNFDL